MGCIVSLIHCVDQFVGRFYLVDSRYAGTRGYLGPHKEHRYHLREFEDRGLEGENELFNSMHASLRNVIERAFGTLKERWRILKEVPHYPRMKQSQIILACFGLHNFLVDKNPSGAVKEVDDWTGQWIALNASEDMSGVHQFITTMLPYHISQ